MQPKAMAEQPGVLVSTTGEYLSEAIRVARTVETYFLTQGKGTLRRTGSDGSVYVEAFDEEGKPYGTVRIKLMGQKIRFDYAPGDDFAQAPAKVSEKALGIFFNPPRNTRSAIDTYGERDAFLRRLQSELFI